MANLRFCTFFLVSSIVAGPVLAKDETLADRGKRMCEEAGIPLSECTILPPQDRIPAEIPIAETTRLPEAPAAARTGAYGWCAECTSLFGAAAAVEPWSRFGGRSYSSLSDNDERTALADASGGNGGGDGGGNGGGDGGGNGGGDGGGNGGGDGGGNGGGDGGGNGGGDGGGNGGGGICR